MWTEMKPFMPFETILQEVHDALEERGNALRYVLQTYYSSDLQASNLSSYLNYMDKCKPFTDVFNTVLNLHGMSMQIFQRTSTATSGLYYYWCKTPNIVDNRIESYFNNHTGSMFDRVPKYSGATTDSNGGQSKGSVHNNIVYDALDDLVWFCNHAYYIGVANTADADRVDHMYNFAISMGDRNFVYGENALV